MSVAQPPGRPGVQLSYPKEADHRRQLAQAINRLNEGHSSTTLFVTLDPNVVQTSVVDSRISPQTAALLQPQTAHAAAALPTTWIVCTDGSLEINHANSAQTDRTYTISLSG